MKDSRFKIQNSKLFLCVHLCSSVAKSFLIFFNSNFKIQNSKLNKRGFTIAELLVAFIVMIIATAAIAELMVGTVKVYLTAADQTLVQGNAKWVLDRMSSEIRVAYPVFTSDSTNIRFAEYGVNLTSPDNDYDTVCYRFVAPSGNPYDATSYKPGYINRGSTPGGDTSCGGNANYQRVTDFSTDIRELEFEYCRPGGGNGTTPGVYNCNTTVTYGNLNANLNEKCIFLISIRIKASRRLSLMMNPSNKDVPVYEMKATVRPRSTYLASIQDNDKDGQVDCCATLGANWCLTMK